MTGLPSLTPASVRCDLFGLGGGGKGKPCGEGWISSRLNCGNSAVNRVYETAKSTQGALKAGAFNAVLVSHRPKSLRYTKGVSTHKVVESKSNLESYTSVFSVKDKVGLFAFGQARNNTGYLERLGILKPGKKMFTVVFSMGGSSDRAANTTLSRGQRRQAIARAETAFKQTLKQLEEGTILHAQPYDDDEKLLGKKRRLYEHYGFRTIEGSDDMVARVGKAGEVDRSFNPNTYVAAFNKKLNERATEYARKLEAEHARSIADSIWAWGF